VHGVDLNHDDHAAAAVERVQETLQAPEPLRSGGMRRVWLTLAAAALLAAGAVLAALSARPARGESLSSLNSQLSAQQAHQRALSASLAQLNALIASLQRQVTLVRQREAAVQAQLAQDRLTLARTQLQLVRERAQLEHLRLRLRSDQSALAGQLRADFESPPPTLIDVALRASSFAQLLDQLQYLGDAAGERRQLIDLTRQARDQASSDARRLAMLERQERQITEAAATRVRALAGMNALLSQRLQAQAQARQAEQAALAASRERGAQLQSAIARVQAEQAAAARAAAAAPTPTGPALGPSGGWAIPYPIVLCESGGQNLTPNSAGASGYYQIIPGTWRLYGGSGPAAYLAGKAEQDAVAARIWNGGAGASAWVCARILGYVK
jgi:septal ring factor EnvC (AmiA/AmiB activator)